MEVGKSPGLVDFLVFLDIFGMFLVYFLDIFGMFWGIR